MLPPQKMSQRRADAWLSPRSWYLLAAGGLTLGGAGLYWNYTSLRGGGQQKDDTPVLPAKTAEAKPSPPLAIRPDPPSQNIKEKYKILAVTLTPHHTHNYNPPVEDYIFIENFDNDSGWGGIKLQESMFSGYNLTEEGKKILMRVLDEKRRAATEKGEEFLYYFKQLDRGETNAVWVREAEVFYENLAINKFRLATDDVVRRELLDEALQK